MHKEDFFQMRFKSFCIALLAAAFVLCLAGGSDVFGQGRGKGHAGMGRPSNVPPVVNTGRGSMLRKSIYDPSMGSSQPGRHRGWKHKKYTYGYRNYGQYRRTQVGNRRFRYVNRYYWTDGVRHLRRVRVNL